MALAFGEKTVSKAYFGDKAVSAIYLGTKKVFPDEEESPATGDIRLRIKMLGTTGEMSFPLFQYIRTEEGGFVSVDWGDGNKETLTGKTSYQPEHTYAEVDEYVVKLTGSKFTAVGGELSGIRYWNFREYLREILSLKMPKDSTSVSLRDAFYGCEKLEGVIPEWDNCITGVHRTYKGCSGLTGCSKELLWDPMPSRITSHYDCVAGCVDEIRQHFTAGWGGTKA